MNEGRCEHSEANRCLVGENWHTGSEYIGVRSAI